MHPQLQQRDHAPGNCEAPQHCAPRRRAGGLAYDLIPDLVGGSSGLNKALEQKASSL